jgi:hypothetical protein
VSVPTCSPWIFFRETQTAQAKEETGNYDKVKETIADLLSENPDMGYALL